MAEDHMLRKKIVLRAAAAAIVLAAATATPALAFGASAAPVSHTQSVFFIAQLNGNNEVTADGTRGAGDLDGRATELLRIRGDQLTFAATWTGIGAPVAGHIHQGAAGTNGAVVVPFFAGALPATLTAFRGTVTISDASLATAIEANPESFYANLHTADFPNLDWRGHGRMSASSSGVWVATPTH
jgi:hypothetical protein